MTTEQIPGAPFNENALNVVKVDENYVLDQNIDIVSVNGAHTMSLPPNPQYGQRHRIVAASNNQVQVYGNGHAIRGSRTTVPAWSSADYTFGSQNQWVALCCGATGGTGGTGGT